MCGAFGDFENAPFRPTAPVVGFPPYARAFTWHGSCHTQDFPGPILGRHRDLGLEPGAGDKPNFISGLSNVHYNFRTRAQCDSPDYDSLSQSPCGLEQANGLAYHGICSGPEMVSSQGHPLHCKEASLTLSFVSLFPQVFVRFYLLRYGSNKRNIA